MTADIIQVDYEELAVAARRFRQQQAEIQALQQTVAACLRPLQSGGWQGRGSKAFFAEMDEEVLPGIGRLAAGLEEASTTLQAVSDLFANAEEEAAAQLDMGTDAPIAPTGGGSGNAGNFDLASLFFQSGRLILDLVMFEKLTPLLKDIGQLSDPRIIRLLDSKLFEKGLVGVDALFGLLDDLNQGTYGDDIPKATGVNSLDALIQFGIGKAHPYAAAALIVNSVVQLGGEIQIGVQRTLVDLLAVDGEMGALLHHDLDNMAGALEKMNLGNVTKEISEALYETGRDRINLMVDANKLAFQGMQELWRDPSWETFGKVSQANMDYVLDHKWDYLSMGLLGPIAPSGEGWRNWGEAGVAAINVVDGLADWKAATTSSLVNMGVNSLAQQVNTNPFISDSMKQTVNEGTKDFIRSYQKQVDWSINLIDL